MFHLKQIHKQKQKATELLTMDGRSCKIFIQWSDFYFALPGFCVFLECGQLEGVYKIFLNTKVKFLYSCHNNSSLNKWFFLKTAWIFHKHKWITLTLGKILQINQVTTGQDENLKSEIWNSREFQLWFPCQGGHLFFCSWEVYCLSPIAWVIGKGNAWAWKVLPGSTIIVCVCMVACSTWQSTCLMRYS